MTHAESVLDYARILERLAAQCETEPAAAKIVALSPSWAEEEVRRLLVLTSEAHRLLAESPPPTLAHCRSLENPLNRAKRGGTLGGQELFQVGEALSDMRQVKAFLSPKRESFPLLWGFAQHLAEAPKVEHALLDSLEASGDVRDSASPQLTSIRAKLKGAQGRIHERIQANVSRFRDYLSDPIFTIRDGRYVIPVKAEHKSKVRGVVHDTSGTGQTVFVEPEDVLQASNHLRELEAAEREECARILAGLSAKVGTVADEATLGLAQAANLDLALAKARLAYEMRASIPELKPGHGLKLQCARHPILEESGVPVVPLDLEVGFGVPALLVTGPNTGGKTVAIKAAGLLVLMAQTGLFVPATHAVLGPFSQIWADIGDEQSIQQSLSTFSAHLKNIASALAGLQAGALVLFDEIGAGTDPAEGASLAKAILSDLVARKAVVIASTHYGELKAFAYETSGFANAAMEFDQKSLKPTYRLLMGAPGASHGLRIAERYGIPKSVVEAARSHLADTERDVARLVEQLEVSQRQARSAQSDADKRLNELRAMEIRTKKKLDEAEDIRRTVFAQASATIEEALRELRNEARELFEELKANPDTKRREAIRDKLKNLDERGREVSQKFETGSPKQAAAIVRGASVKAQGFTQIGTVLAEPKDGKVEVQLGALKMTLPVDKLIPVHARVEPPRKQSTSLGLQKAQTASREIHLRAMRAGDAEQTLDRFLDDAVLAGIDQVRIVHGKGEGILRTVTREILRKRKDVASFRDGEPAEGGHGVTIAVFS